MTWQPIETAPRDEAEILGYWAVTKVYRIIQWVEGVDAKGRVHADWCETESGMLIDPPTHWQPLPPPPVAP